MTGQALKIQIPETKPARKSLLFFINNIDFLISHRLDIVLAARDEGYDVHIAAPLASSVARIHELGFHFHPIDLSRSKANPFREIRSFFQIFQIFRSLKPHVLHLVTIKPVIYGGIAARLLKIPLVVSAISGLGYVFIAHGVIAAIRRFFVTVAYRLACQYKRNIVILQNPTDQKEFIQSRIVPAHRVVMIKGSGVDLDVFHPTPEPTGDQVTVLFASRLLKDKGILEFIEAARTIKQENKNVQFVVAGDTDPGNPSSISEELLTEWADQGTIRWIGFQSKMSRALSTCNIFCLPSYREGLPKALIEACACQRAIVTTDVPGCRDVVTHGFNGLLVPPKNSSKLAEALRTLIQHEDLRKTMAENGRNRAVKEFSIESTIRATLQIYENAI